MKCHYCGKEVWLVRHLLDGDFCSPAHRRKYHERLRKSFEQLPKFEAAPAGIAGFNLRIPLADPESSHLPVGASFQSRWSGPHTPAASRLRLAPVAGESFLPLKEAAFAGAPGLDGLTVAVQQIGLAAPAPDRLAASLRVMPQAAIRSRLGLMQKARVELALVGAQTGAAAADPLPAAPHMPAEPARESLAASLWVMPRPVVESRGGPMREVTVEAAPLPAPQVRALAPEPLPALPADSGDLGLRLGTVWAPFEEPVFSGSAEEKAPARVPALGSWMATPVPPVAAAATALPVPDTLAPVCETLSEMGHNGFPRPIGCRPPVSPRALLIAAAMEAPETVALRGIPEPVAAAVQPHLAPALPAAAGPQLEREMAALGKPMPLAGWNSTASEARPLAYGARDAAMPALRLLPLPAGLPAGQPAAVSLQALTEAAAAVAGAEVPQIPPAAMRTPALPALATMAAALPEARSTAQVSPASVHPLEQAGVPSYQASLVLRGETAAADGIGALADLPAMDLRLRAGHIPAAPITPTAPQSAQPLRPCQPMARIEPAAFAGLPEGQLAGARFSAAGPATAAPVPVSQPSRSVMPVPQFAVPDLACLGEVRAQTLQTSIPPLADIVPLDVYMQRVSVSRKRDCEPVALPVRPALPPFALGTWPARLEQLVLQDWRRRYPSRPIKRGATTGARVLAMPNRQVLVARLVQEAPQFFKAAAAALLLGAILWMAGSSKGVRQALSSDQHWLRQTIARRATLELGDNFRSGLSMWDGRKSWAKSWSYDKDGFMRTGQLALYRPSNKLTNYRLEFFAQIEKKSMGWVVRAQDSQNYYAMKLTVTEPGPRPLVAVVHYPVLGGQKGKRVQVPVPVMMHNRTPYRVAVDVKGDRFRTFIEGQEIDEWRDSRLRAGGVGFFSETGEQARLYWVKVSNNTDWLGRLCGLIAGNQGGENQATNLGDTEPGPDRLLALSVDGILDGAKSVDQRRRGPVPAFGFFFWNLE